MANPSYNTAFTHREDRPRSAGSIFGDADSADNPAPAKSDDPRYALKPVRVRECRNVMRNFIKE